MTSNNEIPKFSLQNFPKLAYALIRGRTWQYYISKLSIIIGRGRTLQQKRKNIKWQVDVELGIDKRISKQHCLIIYNFDDKTFEIKCLSKKKPVIVDNCLFTHLDKAVPLKHGSLISLGRENFMFFLAKTIQDSLQDNIMDEII